MLQNTSVSQNLKLLVDVRIRTKITNFETIETKLYIMINMKSF